MKIKAKIDRMVNAGNVKAIASVSLDGMFVVKNLKVMDGKKGLFVSMPQETFTGKDGQKKYSNTFFALTNSAKLELQESVLQAYQQQMDPMLLGLGIMLAAGEVPRIAQQFGLDSSVRVNMSSVIYSTNSAVNLTRNLMKAKPA